MPRLGHVEGSILSIIFEGVSVGLIDSPRRGYHVPSQFNKKRKSNINPYYFNRSVRGLIDKKLLEEKKIAAGYCELVLTEAGEKQAKGFSIFDKSIKFKKSKKWDKKWRVVIFDIPEKNRRFRDILRSHLYALDFYKIQKSVFVSPHPYEKSILELVSVYSAMPYVRVITAEKVDNEKELRKHFFSKKK